MGCPLFSLLGGLNDIIGNHRVVFMDEHLIHGIAPVGVEGDVHPPGRSRERPLSYPLLKEKTPNEDIVTLSRFQHIAAEKHCGRVAPSPFRKINPSSAVIHRVGEDSDSDRR